ncbi:MAG: transglycosylase SLT domain-containing protein [Pseudohongiellaceae bacterium]
MIYNPAVRVVCLPLLATLLAACASSPPTSVANICEIFEDRRSWYRAAKHSEQRWGIPMSVNMAFIYQESSFRSRAKPARNRFLWIFPGRRPSSAYGYAQALDTTWQEYEQKSGNSRASRRNFEDAVDFVAWYNANSTRTSNISTNNAMHLYYAYHEGNGGYQRGSYRNKQWLIDAAGRVQANSSRFAIQLDSCRRELDKNWFQRLIS